MALQPLEKNNGCKNFSFNFKYEEITGKKFQAGQRKRMDPDPKSVTNWAGSGFGQKEYGSEFSEYTHFFTLYFEGFIFKNLRPLALKHRVQEERK